MRMFLITPIHDQARSSLREPHPGSRPARSSATPKPGVAGAQEEIDKECDLLAEELLEEYFTGVSWMNPWIMHLGG